VTVLPAYDRDADSPDDYRGLLWRRPGLAVIFAIMLLSLAGIPLVAAVGTQGHSIGVLSEQPFFEESHA